MLRREITKLATAHPELRAVLVPLLRKTSHDYSSSAEISAADIAWDVVLTGHASGWDVEERDLDRFLAVEKVLRNYNIGLDDFRRGTWTHNGGTDHKQLQIDRDNTGGYYYHFASVRTYTNQERKDAAVIAWEVIAKGKSSGWEGASDQFQEVQKVLMAFNIRYTNPERGEWTYAWR